MFRNKSDLVKPNWRITKFQKSFFLLPFHFRTNCMKKQELLQFIKFFTDTLLTNINDNPLIYVGSRQEQIIMAKTQNAM